MKLSLYRLVGALACWILGNISHGYAQTIVKEIQEEEFYELPIKHLVKTPEQSAALRLLKGVDTTKAAVLWPGISARRYLYNVVKNVLQPHFIYQGSGTNFCGYAATLHVMLLHQPSRYIQLMRDLLEKGQATCGTVTFNPSPEIVKAAGTFAGNGKLDIRDADQVIFLVLADHFKGYLNAFDKKFHRGNENNWWSSTNYAKFNRMLSSMMEVDLTAKGADLLRPNVRDVFLYLQEQLKADAVMLYVNSKYLNPSKHYLFKFRVPCHFIQLHQIETLADGYLITYWDYGLKTRQAITNKMFKKLIFGITTVNMKKA